MNIVVNIVRQGLAKSAITRVVKVSIYAFVAGLARSFDNVYVKLPSTS